MVLFVVSACARSGFSREDAARVCSTLQVCMPDDFAVVFGGSMGNCTTADGLVPLPGTLQTSPIVADGLVRPLGDIYACLLGARGDCAKAARCWAQVGDPTSCSPASGLQSGACDGTLLSGCTAAGSRFATDCGSYGEVCGTRNVFLASFASCGAAKCPTTGTRLGCRGSTIELCQGSLLVLGDCARAGLRCAMPADGGNAECMGGASCDSTSEMPRCEGAVAVTCVAGGQEVRIDCAANPTMKRCQDGLCAATGSDCVEEPSRCEAGVLSYCQDGSAQRFDCVAEGFGACDGGRCAPR